MVATFTIVPKDKRILKSSKVRAHFKMLNDILEPRKQEIMDRANEMVVNTMIYGTSMYMVD